MFGNGRETIGVFISHINECSQRKLIHGMITKARELNYNTAFFTEFGNLWQNDYDIGETFIAYLPNYEALDGIIIVPDTMKIPQLEERYKKLMKEHSSCPVVSVRKELPEYDNVLVDDYTVIDEIIGHFIEIHGFTRINFLAETRGNPESEKRLASYRKILSDRQIPYNEDQIYYGNLLLDAGEAASEHWLNNGKELPQAVICASDYLALSLCKALAERDIQVPNQIAVSGCGDIEHAAEYSPSLTTARIPLFEMGIQAVDKIHKHILGIEQPKDIFMRTETVYRSSCGCKKHWYHESNERRRNHIHIREELNNQISRNAYMSTDLIGLTKLDELVQKIWKYIQYNNNLDGFCMCLNREWDSYSTNEEALQSLENDEVIMEAGVKNQDRMTKIRFSRKELIPQELSKDQPMAYFFTLLHHQCHCFGYAGISFKQIQTYMQTYQAWLINISNALENIRIHSEMNRLVYQLEDMSIRDELTGLYNRRVLETIGKKYLKQCVETHAKLMIFTADMDKLKYINDKYGHASGDIAIKAVADALLHTADDDEICIRLGGDEFMAIGMDYDEAKMSKFISGFMQELNKFNFSNIHEFEVYISYGCNLVLPDEKTTIETCLMEADTRMYQQKKNKNTNDVKANLTDTF